MLSASWDETILKRALEDLSESRQSMLGESYDSAMLRMAHLYCKDITAFHSKSFFLASGLLPGDKKKAIRALYAFCRTTDDIVDRPGPDCELQLERWKERSLSHAPRVNDPVSIAWADARARFRVPLIYARQLIDGVALDLHIHRYERFSDLTAYCYGVASTVGLMSMHIVGYSSEEAIRYAVKLGVALQLTNILRDIAEDWDRGRLYLPQEELAAFGVSEEHLSLGIVDDAWRAFLRFQIERARRIYDEAWPGIRLLHPAGRLAIAAAASFYKDILVDIEKREYDIFQGRAHVSGWGKLRKLPHLWYEYGNDIGLRTASFIK